MSVLITGSSLYATARPNFWNNNYSNNSQIEFGAVIVAAYGRSGTHYASERALRSPRFGDEMRVLRQFLMGKGGRDRRQIVRAGVG